MLFNSYIYIFLFLPLVFILYFGLHRLKFHHLALTFITLASLFYYAYWDPKYLLIILISIIINFYLGMKISRSKNPWFLRSAIVLNLIPLLYFKYSNFILDNMTALLGLSWSAENIVLPLGISFFTFQQIAYLVDCSRGECEDYSFWNYCLFVCFFPQLIAGPIVHHKQVMPQFLMQKNFKIDLSRVNRGLFIFAIGLFKKIVIADTFAPIVARAYDQNLDLTFWEAHLSALSYTIQLYFDFSGYSDMAIGSGLLFNIDIPNNFFSPYKSKNIQEFWKRWHMTLGAWLRDYIYIPLGGNRGLKVYRNLFFTFLIGGIWHGAGWGFLVWGALHGLAIALHRYWQIKKITIPTAMATFLTFLFAHFCWVFFRAPTLGAALEKFKIMFGSKGIVISERHLEKWGYLQDYGFTFGKWCANLGMKGADLIILMALALLLIFCSKNSLERLSEFKADTKHLVFTSIILMIAIFYLNKESAFLYFQF